MIQPLDPLGRPVQIGRVVLRTPGLAGSVDVAAPGEPEGLRAAQEFTDTLRTVFGDEGIEPLEMIFIEGAVPVTIAAEVTRSTRTGEPAIEVEVPAPSEGWEQVILATDEAGIMTWHLAVTSATGGDVSRSAPAGTQTFLVRSAVPPPLGEDDGVSRGLVGAIGRKVLQVLAFRAVEAAGGVLSSWAAGRWEAAKRPYLMRRFDPDTYRDASTAVLGGQWWAEAGASRRPILLMLHGTFSRTHSCFGGLSREAVADLNRVYAGQVAGFDHFTLSHDPVTNVAEMVQRLPVGVPIDLDIIAHSRGGLVARVLAEKQAEISLGSRSLRIRKVIFVGTPNAGTILTDTKYMGDLVDRYTNLLNLFPTNGVTDVLGAVIDTVKHLAVGAADRLVGLAAMRPDGEFLSRLNRTGQFGGDAEYFTVGSDYEPTHVGLRAYLRNEIMDRIFDAANDLVVPEAGVHDLGRYGELPVAGHLDLDATRGVCHSNYFSDLTTCQQILGWLGH